MSFTHHVEPVLLEKNRVEALSDGVFAIAMTLLIIEIKIPVIKTDQDNLFQALLSGLSHLLPDIFSYFLSFAIIGMFWMSHHFIFQKHAKKIDRNLSHLNNLYLSLIAFIPFSTHLLAKYFNISLTVAIYGLNIFLASLISISLLLYMWKSNHIDNGDLTQKLKNEAKLRLGVITFCSLLGMFFAFIYSPISIFLYVFSVVFNIVPGFINLAQEIIFQEKFD
jgi:uncharacterized membrane protein